MVCIGLYPLIFHDEKQVIGYISCIPRRWCVGFDVLLDGVDVNDNLKNMDEWGPFD